MLPSPHLLQPSIPLPSIKQSAKLQATSQWRPRHPTTTRLGLHLLPAPTTAETAILADSPGQAKLLGTISKTGVPTTLHHNNVGYYLHKTSKTRLTQSW
jgi:hypothetical protein